MHSEGRAIAVKFEKLVLAPEQQLEVDRQVLDITIQAITARSTYYEMAWLLTTGSLAAKLEGVNERVSEAAFNQMAATPALEPGMIGLLGQLSFINALELPTRDIVPKGTPDACRALGDWHNNRRLFAVVPPVGKPAKDRRTLDR